MNRRTTWCATTGNVQPHAVPGHACRPRRRAFAFAVIETHASERLGQDRPRRSGFFEQRCQAVVVLSHPVIECRPKRTRTRRLKRRSDLLHSVCCWSLAPYRCPWEISLRYKTGCVVPRAALRSFPRRANATMVATECHGTRHSGATARSTHNSYRPLHPTGCVTGRCHAMSPSPQPSVACVTFQQVR